MSVLAKVVKNVACRIKMKEITEKVFLHPKRNTSELRASKFSDKLMLDEWKVEDSYVLTVKKRKGGGRHVIFFHGGAYVEEALFPHRLIIERFVKKYHLKVSFIDYPLAPEHTYIDTYRVCLKAYKEIVDKHPKDIFYLFGDSAGGGLALGFLQLLRKERIVPYPVKTVLASPWLDLTLSNPDIKDYEAIDCMLPVNALINCGKWYAGKADPKDPLISPMFGNLNHLGAIALFVGTEEIFHPDCVLLKEKLEQARYTTVEFHEGKGMVHDWVVAYPMPEAKKAIDEIAKFYTK